MTLTITDYRQEALPDGTTEISVMLGDQHLWFRIPADRVKTARGEAFLAAALLPAMAAGEDIELNPNLPVCPVFLAGCHSIQQVLRHWGPAMRQPFRIVAINAAVAAAPPSEGSATFFSGGIDGTFTFLEAPQPVDYAVFVRGVDFQLDNPVYDEAFERNRSWLAQRDVPLIGMSSNIRWVLREFGIGWNTGFGAGLAAFAHLLGFRTTYIASGHTWSELWPDGSHPAIDPLWSSETRRIVHHGRGSRRWQKLARIAREPGALDILRVCWMDRGYNCGECEKCVRTMVLLRLLNLNAPGFPTLRSMAQVADRVPTDHSESRFVSEAIELAVVNRDRPLERALRRALRRYEFRRWLVDADRAFLGGWLRKFKGSKGSRR